MLSSIKSRRASVQSQCPRLSRGLSRRRNQPLPRLRPDPLADRPAVGRMRVLLDRASAQGSGDRGPAPAPVFWSGSPPELRRAQRRLTISKFRFRLHARGCMLGRMKSLVILRRSCSLRPPRRRSPGASNFTLVNGTGAGSRSSRSAARALRTGSRLAPRRRTARGVTMTFKDPDCAFDHPRECRAASPVTWAGVNLCDVKSVTSEARSVGRRLGRLRPIACGAARRAHRDRSPPPARGLRPNRATCRRQGTRRRCTPAPGSSRPQPG